MVGYQLDDFHQIFTMEKWLVGNHHFHPLKNGWKWSSRWVYIMKTHHLLGENVLRQLSYSGSLAVRPPEHFAGPQQESSLPTIIFQGL